MSDSEAVSVTPMRELIAEEIRALMGRRKIGVSELARRIGVSQPYLSRRLNGDVAIDVDDLARIAYELGVQIGDLLPQLAGVAARPTREGHTVVVAGEPGRSTTVANHTLATRSHLVGQHKHATPHDSSRRPVRLSSKHA